MKITVDDNTNMINIECDDKKQAVNIVEWILSNKKDATVKCIDDAEIIYQKGFSDAVDILREIIKFYNITSSHELRKIFPEMIYVSAFNMFSSCDFDLRKMFKLINDYKSKENVNGD